MEVRRAGLGGGSFLSARAEDGHVYAAMANSKSFSGDGGLVVVRLEKKRGPPAGAMVRPNLVGALLNEGVPPVEIERRGPQPVVDEFKLGPASPNPFTMNTAGFSATEKIVVLQ